MPPHHTRSRTSDLDRFGYSYDASFVPLLPAAAILVFLHTMGAFGVILMVGGSIEGETRVASIAIYEAVESMQYREAWVLSLAFLPISYGFLLLVNRLTRKK